MVIKMKRIVFIIFFFSMAALATEPPELPLRGQGDYKWLFLHIYEARLWGEKSEDVYSGPLLLELKYSRSFKGKDIVEQSLKELLKAGNLKSDRDEWEKKLLEIFPDVKEGDVIQARFSPRTGIVFYLNSVKELGRLTDLNTSKKFLDIWLGEKTSAPELKKNF